MGGETLPPFMEPRIYVYKITFEEIPDWYWGVHKEKKRGEAYLGSPVTHSWKWEFYTPQVQVLQEFPYTDEGWASACSLEKRLIIPDLNNPLCLNERVQGILSVASLRRGGKKSIEMGFGFASFDRETLQEFGKKVGASGLGGKANGQSPNCAFRNSEVQSKNGSKGGKHRSPNGGKASASQKWMCTVTGHISNAPGLARYQNARGINPLNRVRIK
jgi:hypothetical protein